MWGTCLGTEDAPTMGCGQAVWDEFRGGVMQTAKPILSGAALILPGGQLVRAAAQGITSAVALSTLGNAAGIYMTGSSLQDTAEACSLRTDQDDGACLRSAGMTAFSAWSSVAGLKGVKALTNIAKAEQGAVGVSTSRALTGYASSDDAVISLRQFGDEALETGTTFEQVMASSDDVILKLGKSVYSPVESNGARIIRDGLGTIVFGANAAEACTQEGARAVDCALSIGMAGVMGARFVSGLAGLAPASRINTPTTQRSIGHLDVSVNTAQAVVACSAAAFGEVPFEQCATTVMMAGLSAGQLAQTQAVGEPTSIKNPYIEQSQAIADKVALANWKVGQKLTINGIEVTEVTKLSVQSEVNTRLAITTNAVARETYQILELSKQFAKEKASGPNPVRDELIKSLEVYKKFFDADGVMIKEKISAEMVEAARLAVRLNQSTYEQQQLARIEPEGRTALDKILGSETTEFSEYRKAAAVLEGIVKTESATSAKYVAALQATELLKTIAAEARMTPAKRAIALAIRDLQYGSETAEGLVDMQAKIKQIEVENSIITDPSKLPEVKQSYEAALKASQESLVELQAKTGASKTLIAETERIITRTKEAIDSIAKLEADGIFGKSIVERMTAVANNKVELASALQKNITKAAVAIAGKQQEFVKAGTLRGKIDLATKPIKEKISDLWTGKSVREAVYKARIEYADAFELVTRAENNKKLLIKEAGSDPTPDQSKAIESIDRTIIELTQKANEALAISNAKEAAYTSSLRYKWFGPKEISTAKQVVVADTLGKLSVVADALTKEGFQIVRGADKQLYLVDMASSENTLAGPKNEATVKMLDEASKFLRTIEDNLSAATGGRISEMIGPDHLTRVDQSEIFIKALFDTEISGHVKGVLFNGQTGLGKSAFLLNAIADAKVKLTGAKVNVLATSWADVLGMMKDYSPLVHHQNEVKAVYYNPSGAEIIYVDEAGVQQRISNHQNDVLAKQILSNADIIYSPTLETPYEFHASRNGDLLTQGFREGDQGRDASYRRV